LTFPEKRRRSASRSRPNRRQALATRAAGHRAASLARSDAVPVGSPAPAVKDRSILPAKGSTCHLTAGARLENPALARPRTAMKYDARSRNSSAHGAIPRRNLLAVPSTMRTLSRAATSMPFSLCRVPAGTTMLELVTSGRSVVILSLEQRVPALAEKAARLARAEATPASSVRDARTTILPVHRADRACPRD